jgi:hypothetical protein
MDVPVKLGARVSRVSHRIRDYSKAIASDPERERLAALSTGLLRGAAAVIGANEAAAWRAPTAPADPPLVTHPANLAPRRVDASRQMALRAISGQPLRADHVAAAVTRSPEGLEVIFVFVRRRREPFSRDDRRLLLAFTSARHAGGEHRG